MLTYGFQCTIDGDESSGALLARLFQVAERWADGLRSRPTEAGKAPTVDKQSKSETEWVIHVEHQHEERGVRGAWQTELHAGYVTDSTVELALTMRLSPEQRAIAPVRYYVETPHVLRDIAGAFHIRIGDSRPSKAVTPVETEQDVTALIKRLQSPGRGLPIVALATMPDGTEAIAPEGVVDFIFPLAEAFAISPDATFMLTEEVGRQMSVFDGGVRVYWPGWQREDPPHRHPLYTRHRILAGIEQRRGMTQQRWISRKLMERLCRASAAAYQLPDGLARLVAQRDSECGAERDELEKLRREADHSFDEWTKADARIRELEEELDSRQVLDVTFPSVKQAIDRAGKDFEDTLIIANGCLQETSESGQFWYFILLSLNELCLRRRANTSGRGDEREVLNALIRRWLPSINVYNRYKNAPTGEYVRNPRDGQRVELRERLHIIEGRPSATESIYWTPVTTGNLPYFLIGRIGRHA